jgi:hypothetical protein
MSTKLIYKPSHNKEEHFTKRKFLVGNEGRNFKLNRVVSGRTVIKCMVSKLTAKMKWFYNCFTIVLQLFKRQISLIICSVRIRDFSTSTATTDFQVCRQ